MATTTNSLEMRFTTAEGNQTTMTLSGAKTGMSAATVKAQMQAMVTSGAFATASAVAYQAPYSAAYITRTVDELFEETDE